MTSRTLLAIVLVASLTVAVGCARESGSPEPAVSPPASPAETSTATATDATGTPSASAPLMTEVYREAAAAAIFPVYEPGFIPARFAYLESESKTDQYLVAVAYAAGESRILIIQGGWDLAEDGELLPGSSVTFGPLSARRFEDVPYAWAPDSAEYAEDGDAVIATTPDGNYMVLGIKTSLDELFSVASSMRAVP